MRNLPPLPFDFQDSFGNFRRTDGVLALRIRNVSLGIARQFYSLVLSRVSAAWFENIGGNLLVCWERRARRTLSALRFCFKVPDIKFVAIDPSRFVPIKFGVNVFFHGIGRVENMNT